MKNETYNEYVCRISHTRENKRDKNAYQERHHIVPKCLGGDNSKDNLIYLYAQEHYYAHRLLALENPQNKSLQYAWWNMCQALKNGRRYKIDAKEYSEARERIIPFQREFIKTNRCGVNNPNFGKHFSQEHRQKLALAHIGLPKSSETIALISKNHANVSGANNPRARAIKCVETGDIFGTQLEGCKWCGISPYTMRKHLKGLTNYGGKNPETNEYIHWEYVK